MRHLVSSQKMMHGNFIRSFLRRGRRNCKGDACVGGYIIMDNMDAMDKAMAFETLPGSAKQYTLKRAKLCFGASSSP